MEKSEGESNHKVEPQWKYSNLPKEAGKESFI